MQNVIPEDKKAFLENVRKYAKKYNIRITGISTTIGGELYISYKYDDERDFKFITSKKSTSL